MCMTLFPSHRMHSPKRPKEHHASTNTYVRKCCHSSSIDTLSPHMHTSRVNSFIHNTAHVELALPRMRELSCCQSILHYTHLFHCVEHRCGGQAQSEVCGCGLTHVFCCAHVVQHVIHQLECKACVLAVLKGSLTYVIVTASQNSHLVQRTRQVELTNRMHCYCRAARVNERSKANDRFLFEILLGILEYYNFKLLPKGKQLPNKYQTECTGTIIMYVAKGFDGFIHKVFQRLPSAFSSGEGIVSHFWRG